MAEESIKPEYFITRPNGSMVPLLAVDEFPYHINLVGVSRVMTPFDIAGMTCIGSSKIRHKHYDVKSAPELAATNKTTDQEALKAKFFLTRDSGNLVPVVAMDEMPQEFVVENISRSASVFDLGGMTCVGNFESRKRTHTVEDFNNASLSYLVEKMALKQGSLESEDMSGATVPVNTPDMLSTHSASEEEDATIQAPKTDASASTIGIATPAETTPSPHPLPSRPETSERPSFPDLPTVQGTIQQPPAGNLIPGQKEYCSYWLRHGECDYQQQGCLYKHEMPLDRETLEFLGLRDIPRWFREKYGCGSYLAASGSGAGFSDQGLTSEAARGANRQNRQGAMAENWRVPRNNNLAMVVPARGNTYIVRDRPSISTADIERLFHGHIPRPSPIGGPRNNDNIRARGARQAPNHRERRESIMSTPSDVEAIVNRDDTERRAREDADYQRILNAEAQNRAVETARTTLESQASGDVRRGPAPAEQARRPGTGARGGGRPGHRGRGRGGRRGNGRRGGSSSTRPAGQ